MSIIKEIQSERQRQIEKEGWSKEHDRQHDNGELAYAAACYAAPEPIYVHRDEEMAFLVNDGDRGDRGLMPEGYYTAFPWEPEADKRRKHDRRRQLIIAAALILAELERLEAAATRVQSDLAAFAQSNGLVASCDVEDRPPRVRLWFYLPAQTGKRKTVGYNIGKGDESNVVQVYVPNETELDMVADFIGQLADRYNLRAYRKQGSDLLSLWYELKARY